MDYGYQLLRHVVQQVFGNLRQAALLTLPPFVVPLVLYLWLTGDNLTLTAAEGPGAGVILGALALAVIVVVAYCWAAVAWHRYVLLEETGRGLIPVWRGDRVLSYLGRAFVVFLVMLLAGIAGGLFIGIVAALTASVALAVVLGVGLVFGVSWIATRVGLVLPAAAIGERMTIGESWAATRPVGSQILLPLIVIALVVGLVQQLVGVLFGQTLRVESFGVMQDQVVLSMPGQIITAVVSWLQILLNLALMTTLYGNLVEGRQLN